MAEATSFATAEQMQLWETRSEIIHHFAAYRFFATGGPEGAIDLVNLDDADLEYYNRVLDMSRGLGTEYKLAEYLQTFADLPKAPSTFRKRFIGHVRNYNLGVSMRRRFYVLGATIEELGWLNSLTEPVETAQGYQESMMNLATDGCTDRSFGNPAQEDFYVAIRVKSCLADHEAARSKCGDDFEHQMPETTPPKRQLLLTMGSAEDLDYEVRDFGVTSFGSQFA